MNTNETAFSSPPERAFNVKGKAFEASIAKKLCVRREKNHYHDELDFPSVHMDHNCDDEKRERES